LPFDETCAYSACVDHLAFIGHDLAPGDTLVRAVTARLDGNAGGLAVIAQADGAHLVVTRSIRGNRQMRRVFADLNDEMRDDAIRTIVESIHDGGIETVATEGAEAGAAALEQLAAQMAWAEPGLLPEAVESDAELSHVPRRAL
jgi:hypothetical protein